MNLNFKIAIVGVGQLGCRYLEGIIKSINQLKIYLVDPNPESLQKALLNLINHPHPHIVTTCQSIPELPSQLDLIIVSTNADVRAEVVKELVGKVQFPYLILEKVLFQHQNDLLEIEQLLINNGISCWVNHPKRVFKSYHLLKSYLPPNEVPMGLMATGNDWGIACNGLHVLDTWSFLIGDFVENCTVTDTSLWVDSHRIGFKDLQGCLMGNFIKGTPFILSSYQGKRKPLSIFIDYPNLQVFMEEINGDHSIKIFNKGESNPSLNLSFDQEYQSSISASLVDQILKEGTCGLPSYASARINHIPFLKGLSKHFFQSELTTEKQILPIT